CLAMLRPRPQLTLFPYTTLFRSTATPAPGRCAAPRARAPNTRWRSASPSAGQGTAGWRENRRLAVRTGRACTAASAPNARARRWPAGREPPGFLTPCGHSRRQPSDQLLVDETPVVLAQDRELAGLRVHRGVPHVLLVDRANQVHLRQLLEHREVGIPGRVGRWDRVVLVSGALGLVGRVERKILGRLLEQRRELLKVRQLDRGVRGPQRDELLHVGLEDGPLCPRTERLVDVRVDAARGDLSDKSGGCAVERVDEQAREDTRAFALHGVLLGGRRSHDGDTLLDLGELGDVGTGAGDAAVATVEDDHLVLGRGIICVGHDVSQRETVVPLGAVAGAQEPAGAVDVPVAGKVE